jgi:hypothetical protein
MGGGLKMNKDFKIPFARLVYHGDFIDEEIYLFEDLTYMKSVYHISKIRVNGGYFVYLKKLIKDYMKRHKIKDYDKKYNYIYNYEAKFNFVKENDVWVQTIYKYDLRQAYYYYFRKLFNNRLIQRYFNKLVDYMYSFVKNRHDKKTYSKKSIRRMVLGMLFKSEKEYSYEIYDEEKQNWIFIEKIIIKNKTPLWNKIQYDIIKALEEVCNKYIGKENWVMIWVDCIYTTKLLDFDTLNMINKELKEKINTCIRFKGSEKVVDREFKNNYITIGNQVVAKRYFNYFSKTYILDRIEYEDGYSENMLKPKIENEITIPVESIKKHEAVIETNEIDVFELFETGNVRYLTKEEYDFIENVKNSQINKNNNEVVVNISENEDIDNYDNEDEILFEGFIKENKTKIVNKKEVKIKQNNENDYEIRMIKRQLAKRLEKLLYNYQGDSKWFEFKVIGERIDFDDIYRYSIEDIKRIIEIYELQLEAKMCGYKNSQRLSHTNRKSKFDKDLYEKIKMLDRQLELTNG